MTDLKHPLNHPAADQADLIIVATYSDPIGKAPSKIEIIVDERRSIIITGDLGLFGARIAHAVDLCTGQVVRS